VAGRKRGRRLPSPWAALAPGGDGLHAGAASLPAVQNRAFATVLNGL